MTGGGDGIQHGLRFGREFFCFVIPANAGIQFFSGLALLGLLASQSNFVRTLDHDIISFRGVLLHAIPEMK